METIRFWKRAYWICFAIYWIAYFLPSCRWMGSSEVLFGFTCAYFSFVMIGEWSIFLGNFANFSALLNLVFFLTAKDKRPSLVPAIIGLVMSVIGTLTWLVYWDSLMIGYFVWALATMGMAVAHLLYRIALRAAKKTTERDLSDHLINR